MFSSACSLPSVLSYCLRFAHLRKTTDRPKGGDDTAEKSLDERRSCRGVQLRPPSFPMEATEIMTAGVVGMRYARHHFTCGCAEGLEVLEHAIAYLKLSRAPGWNALDAQQRRVLINLYHG
jgi:hypothetical protein